VNKQQKSVMNMAKLIRGQ
ncbi:Rop family plasmid primer RNA-binding protein, partial [Klebsiella pneumoniae]|nr:Rop family plasmid primer RNA-binding protein [Klebsiella pneumoniae]